MGDKMLEQIDEKSKLTTDGDTAKIKFQSSTNGEAKIEMPENGAASQQCGLTKEELMKYANDPFWIGLRRTLLVLFWLLWIALLVGAVVIIVATPGCPAAKEPEWYEKSPIYEVRVDKFVDGKLRGVHQKLPYLKDIYVSTIVLEELFNPAEQRVISPDIGDLNSLADLTKELKVILKIPLSKIQLSRDDEQRKLAGALVFWLDKGVAGFIFDEIDLIPESTYRNDFPQVVKDCGEIIANASTREFPRVAMWSSYTRRLDEAEFCVQNGTFILDYGLTSLRRGFTASQFYEQFERTTQKNRTMCRENFVFSNGDIKPLIERVTSAEHDRIIMFTLLADATPFVYFGEEHARNDTSLPDTLERKPGNRPMAMNWKTVEAFSKATENNYFRLFKDVSKIRSKNEAILSGETHLSVLDGSVVAMSRTKKKNPGFVVVTNFERSARTVNLTELGPHIPESAELTLFSTNSKTAKGKRNLQQLNIEGEETLLFEFPSI
ncbi:4F2 cell-surface antigen heavy chain-like [Galendromus occidentalis]|uniref:4F2 cell-surface antigen heavy chain-like n=1 Tax=Galendromus occidentalis TaxID=34638 RepID=A0AAJ6QTL2_9ACAR|nr:4F2 cell-surface antigen heavy chain-like [Galendromus occidentalis]